jgi:phage protein U
MAEIGKFGPVAFVVAAKQVQTFEQMEWQSAASFAEHKRHMHGPLLEFTGLEADQMKFTMLLTAYLGTNPIKLIAALLDMERAGTPDILVIGPKAYGRGRWVIVKSSRVMDRFNSRGELLSARVSVELKAYESRW